MENGHLTHGVAPRARVPHRKEIEHTPGDGSTHDLGHRHRRRPAARTVGAWRACRASGAANGSGGGGGRRRLSTLWGGGPTVA